MRALIIAAALAASMPVPARADGYPIHSGNWLLQRCESDNLAHQSFCLGYITAAFAGMEVLLQYNNKDFCVPEGVTQGQMEEVVVRYLRRNPKDRHLSAVVLTGLAAMEAWPCREGFNER